MRYIYNTILAMAVLVSLSAAETIGYFDYETEDEISEGDIEGRSHTIVTYDDRGEITSVSYFDEDGKLLRNESGNHSQVYEYDENDEITTIHYSVPYNEVHFNDPKPRVYWLDYKELKTGEGRFERTSESVFNCYDEPVVMDEWNVHFPSMFDRFTTGGRQYVKGVHRVEKELFGNGEDKSVSFFGIDGKPTTDQHNVHKYEFEWNKNRDLSSFTAINYDGELVNGFFPGYVRLEYAFNGEGRIILRALYGEKGEAISTRDGVHKVTYEKRSGGLYYPQSFDINGEPVDKDMSFTNSNYVSKQSSSH